MTTPKFLSSFLTDEDLKELFIEYIECGCPYSFDLLRELAYRLDILEEWESLIPENEEDWEIFDHVNQKMINEMMETF